MKGHLLSRDTFARHGLVFNCKCPVIRGHLPNMANGQANHKIFLLLPGRRGQFASCENLLNVNFYSPNADFIDLTQNSLCGSAWMVEAKREAMHELCFSALESVHRQTMLIAEFVNRFQLSFSIFDRSLPFCRKNGIQKKTFTLKQRVEVMKVLDSGFPCKDVTLRFLCGKS